uniref:TBC1 domain family member 10B n=1 Tax=Amazona collaria TaxID=241587 RepID=A0A8B9FUF5_9PSIT
MDTPSPLTTPPLPPLVSSSIPSMLPMGAWKPSMGLWSYGAMGQWGRAPHPTPPRPTSARRECPVPVDVARQRELKWLEMLNHWDKWLLKRYQKVKLRCRKGIPSSLRARAWQLLSDSQSELEQHPGLFEELERQPGDPRWLDAIEKDLHRAPPIDPIGHGPSAPLIPLDTAPLPH